MRIRWGLSGFQSLQDLAGRPLEYWVNHVWGDLGERFEDETTFVHCRMRDSKSGSVDHAIVVKQQIEVDGARALRHRGGAVAAEFALDGEQGFHQFLGRQSGLDAHDGVHEVWLRGVADRLGLIER